ncbi:MAG: PKD domain-containing protein, partial [Thiotrichaceae bacterium]|nr:PKD domain-containing protein [Thiotrichaceae bacterium]
ISGNDIATSTTEKYIAIKQATKPTISSELNTSLCGSVEYKFTAQAPNNDNIDTVTWKLDGNEIPDTTDKTEINYQFTKAGTYTITANIVTATSTVTEPQEIIIEEDDLNINCPEANFTISQPVQACRTITYDVDASTATTNDENDPLVGYQWIVLDVNDAPVLSSNYTIENQSQSKATIDIKAIGNYKIGLTVTTQNTYTNTTTQSIAAIATLPEVGCPQQVEFEATALPDGQTFIFTVSPANQTYTWLVNTKTRDFIKLSEGRYKYTITTQDIPFYSPYDEIFYYEVSPQASDATLKPAKPEKLVLKQQNAITLAIPRLVAQLVDNDLILDVLNREEYPDIQVDIEQNNKNLANEETESGQYKFATVDIIEGEAIIQLSANKIEIPLTKQNNIITVKPYVSVITPTLDAINVEAPYSIYVDGSNSYMPMQNDSIDSYQWWLFPTDLENVATCNDADVIKQTTGLQGDLTQARTNLTLTNQGSYKICLTVTSKNGVENSAGTGIINIASYTQHQVGIQRYTGNLAAGNLIPYNPEQPIIETITFYGDVFVANQAKQIDGNNIIVNLSTEDNAVSVFMNIEVPTSLLNSTATIYNILQVIPPNWGDDLGIWYMQTPETYPLYDEWLLLDENNNVNFAALKPSIQQIQLKQNNTIVLYNGDFEGMAGNYNFFVILEQEKTPGDYDYYFSVPPLALEVTKPSL